MIEPQIISRSASHPQTARMSKEGGCWKDALREEVEMP